MGFKIDHKTETVQVSMFQTNEVIQKAGISANNLGYTLVITMYRSLKEKYSVRRAA